MASRRGSSPAGKAPAGPTVAGQPAGEASQLADLEVSETTTDYTRRAGGYVLTDRGWVLGAARDSED